MVFFQVLDAGKAAYEVHNLYASIMALTTTNLPHLVQQVLDLGLRAELLHPPEAREVVARRLRAVLAAHGERVEGEA